MFSPLQNIETLQNSPLTFHWHLRCPLQPPFCISSNQVEEEPAPVSDESWQTWCLCLSCQAISAAVSTAVKGSFLNHLIVLPLSWVGCVSNVWQWGSKFWKSCNGRALLQHPAPDAFAPGKPGGRHFEQITPKLSDFIAGRAQALCLSTFITDRSWPFFHLVGRNAEGWFQRAPEEWPQNPDYTFMSQVARDILVVNDCADRNIIRPLQTKYASHGMSVDC